MSSAAYLTDEPAATGPLLFLRSIRRILARPPLWLATGGVIALLALPVGAAWHAWFRTTVSDRYQPDRAGGEAGEPFLWDDVVHSLSASFRHDHGPGLEALEEATARGGAALAVLALLVGIFAAGGWLQVVLERTQGRSLWRFCLGGGRYFWRFLRLFVVSLALLAAWQWLVYGELWDRWVLGEWRGVPEDDWGELESLGSEQHALALGWLRDGLHALGFALVLAWGTFTRTRLALLDGRSVLKAGFMTFFGMLRHPIKTLRPLGLLFLVELLVVTVLCGQFVQWLEDGLLERPSRGLVLAMLLTGLAALMFREVLRGARYHAAVRVSQEIVRRPPKAPDPWKSIGGPGGPQYPVEEVDGDSYVAM